MITPVVLCGGSGTRLWPRSRKAKPKPFLPLIGGASLFAATLDRCDDKEMFNAPLIVAGSDHIKLIRSEMGTGGTIIVEPVARNTAPAIALAAARLPRDAVMLVCPSDHHIRDIASFRSVVADAADIAEDGHLVAIGIRATAPETGFGYIQRGEELGKGYKVARFVEKPDFARAKEFLDEGSYSWNGGIFVFTAGTFLTELAQFRPDIAELVAKAVELGEEDGDLFHPDRASFAAIDGESIDYAVMEKTGRAATVQADMGWSDIGNWKSLQEQQERDGDGNCVRGKADLVDCRNVLVDSDGPRVSAIGLENIAIVVDGDEILVTTADGAQKVGKLPGAAQQ